MQLSNSKILLDIIEAARKAKVKVQDLSRREYVENGEIASSTAERRFGSWEAAKKKASKADPKELRADIKKVELDKAKEQKKEDILEAYVMLAKRNRSQPKAADLAEMNITRDSISRAFGSMAALDKLARESEPNAFSDVHISSLFSPKALDELDDAIKSHKRLVVTTAVTGCSVHKPSYEAVKKYCEINDALLLILIASDPAHSMDHGEKNQPKSAKFGTIDKLLANEYIVLKDTAINNNLRIDTLKTSAKMIDPVTGVARLGQRNGSLIIASPKQRMKAVPVSNFKLPHVIMTTGAITVSDYNTENYMSERLAKIADHDHQLGAIVVEIEDEEAFHFRQVQFDNEGRFHDIAGCRAVQYGPFGAKDAEAEAIVLGDWHSGDTDPEVANAWKELAAIVKPNYIVIHDGFNGQAINHHEEDDRILRAQRSLNNQLSLDAELKVFASDLDMLSPLARKSLIVVKSNHDEFLKRYLKEGRYVEDAQNHYISLKLALAMFEGLDPLQHAIEDIIGLQESTNVRWLKRAEDFKIARIQLGAHGDKGPNGSKGTLASMENAYGQSITGHSHTAEILRGAWSVGTTSYLKLSYNEDSPSSWMNTSCILWKNGQRQLINSIMGRYILKDEEAE